MALKVSATRATKRTTIPFGDEGDLNVVWHPDVITGALADRLEESRGVGRPLFEALVLAVSEWDLLDESGNVVPLDVDVLYDTIPVALVMQIVAALGADGAGEVNGAI